MLLATRGGIPMSPTRVAPQLAGGLPPPPAVVPRAAGDEDLLPGRPDLASGVVGHGLPSVLHELEDGDAEVDRVAVEDTHLRGRDHRPRIRGGLVKRSLRAPSTWP